MAGPRPRLVNGSLEMHPDLLMERTDVPLIRNPEGEKAEEGRWRGSKEEKKVEEGSSRLAKLLSYKQASKHNQRRSLPDPRELSRSTQKTQYDTTFCVFVLCPAHESDECGTKKLFFAVRTKPVQTYRISSNLVEHCRTRRTSGKGMLTCAPCGEHQ